MIKIFNLIVMFRFIIIWSRRVLSNYVFFMYVLLVIIYVAVLVGCMWVFGWEFYFINRNVPGVESKFFYNRSNAANVFGISASQRRTYSTNSNNKPSSHNAKGKGKGNVKPKKDINEIATINVSDFNIVGDLNTNSFIVIDLKNISKYIVNREFLVNIDLVKLDSELFNYFVYFSLIKVLLTLKEQQNVITQIRELLVTIGIKKSVIKLIINEVMNFNVKTVVNKGGKLEGTNNRVIEKLFFKIEECASRRNATIDVNRLDKFLTLINGFLELDIKDLNIFIIDKIEQFVGQFENIANVDQVRSAQSRKKSDRTVPWTEGRYEKEFNAILKHFTREISDVIMKWLHKDNIIKLDKS